MKEKLTREERRHALLIAILIVTGMLVLAGLIWWASGWEVWEDKGSMPEESTALLDAAQNMDSIAIRAKLNEEQQMLSASQVMTLTNRTGEELDRVVLRSYSGAFLTEDTSPAATDELYDACYPDGFSAGGLIMEKTYVQGESLTYIWSDDAKTVLTLMLDTAWMPGETITVELQYHVNVPVCAGRFGVYDGIWSLGNVFPTLAVREDGAWRTDSYCSIGDPFLSECANWDITLTLPEGYTLVGTDYAEGIAAGQQKEYTLTAHAVRDFALVFGKELQCVTGMEGDTLVIACAKDRSRTREMLKYAKQALRCYEKRYGDYVYPSFTVTESAYALNTMEYPRLVMIGQSKVNAGGQSLEFAVAYGAAHQWWYAMVGSDSINQPWQDESLCEYALMDYIGDYYSTDDRDSAIYQQIETALRITISRDITPGSPITYFNDVTEYTQVVCRRGAALWMALENYFGRDELDDLLRDYAETYRFAIASRDDLTEVISNHAGMDLSELMADYLDTHIDTLP